MGYETKITVVRPYTPTPGYPNHGEFIVSLELGKCGNGPIGRTISAAIENGKASPFSLWPSTPDRQDEAVKYLCHLDGDNEDYLKKLSNDIADGYITKDMYNDPLGVSDLETFIVALKAELELDDWYKYKIALNLLESIKENCADSDKLKVITYGH